jgi:hypothetical protein
MKRDDTGIKTIYNARKEKCCICGKITAGTYIDRIDKGIVFSNVRKEKEHLDYLCGWCFDECWKVLVPEHIPDTQRNMYIIRKVKKDRRKKYWWLSE